MNKSSLTHMFIGVFVIGLLAVGPLAVADASESVGQSQEATEVAPAENTAGSEQRNCQGEIGAPCCQGCQNRARLVEEGKAAPLTGGCPCSRAKAAQKKGS